MSQNFLKITIKSIIFSNSVKDIEMEYSYLSHLNFTADSELDEEILKNKHFNAYLYGIYF